MHDFIFDNTVVLSNLAAIGKVDLLGKLFLKNAFTTIEVVDELKRGIERGYTFLAPALVADSSMGWLEILVTDDIAVRMLATRRNVRLTGTVDLLVEMIHAGLLSMEDGNTSHQKMIDDGYRSPCDRLDDLI